MKNRQIFYIEIDEEVTAIFDRIKNSKKRAIYLVVPKKAILFQSVVNLKILKGKLAEKEKELVIVTTDRNGSHLSKKAGLKVMSRIEVEPVAKEESDGVVAIKIRPIQARRNVSLKEERPQRMVDKKLSIKELIEQFRLKEKKKYFTLPASAFHFSKPGRKFLMLIVLVSSALFMLIGYIALPSATVYIRPKFDHIDFTTNIVLADKRKNQTLLRQNKPRYIASETITTTTKQTKIFKTASKEFRGKNAKGKIKIINTTSEDWELRGGTRFQSAEGIIFRMKEGVTVPPKSREESEELVPGALAVPVEADPFDIYGKPVGNRGNLPPTEFIIPALSKYNQRLIRGESTEPMKGGVTNYEAIVTKDDIEAAKKQLQENLILMAREELKTYLDEVNQLNKTNLVLLGDNRYLKTHLTEMRLSDDLEGSYQEKFEIYAKIEATGVAFDFSQLFNLLKEELKGRTHPSMRLREDSINPDNITYEIIDQDDTLGQIKMTATVVGIEEFAIDSSTKAGIDFGNNIKEKIISMDVEKAEALVGNLPEVDAVDIRTWPLWINKIPRLTERVSIKLMEE